MAREVQEIEEIENPHSHSERTLKHPAFAQIRASRVTGSTTLYDSEFMHNGFMQIEISESELNRNLARDWHFSRRTILELHMSEAQWAHFVSTPNFGGGTPCTLTFRESVGEIPGIPYRQEEDEIKRDFENETKKLAKEIATIRAEMDGELGNSMSKVKKERILSHVETIERKLQSSLPFIANSFDEHMENTVNKARIEVSAYIMGAVQRAGFEELQKQNRILQLGAGDEE